MDDPLAWKHWVARYEERGFTVLNPGHPGVAGAAAVEGIRALPFSEIRSTFPVLSNPANMHHAAPITNTLTKEQSQAADDRYAVSVSGRM